MDRHDAPDFDPQTDEVDPPDIDSIPRDKQRKNIWLSNQLVRDLEDIVTEDESNLSTVMRQALKYYVRYRKEGAK